MAMQFTEYSGNAKTGDIANTSRASVGRMFGTCPKVCSLNPLPEESTNIIDSKYLTALLGAVPCDGLSFTYSHFDWRKWGSRFLKRLASGKPTTCINYSANNRSEAIDSIQAGIPTVIPLPVDEVKKVERIDGIRFIQCPATYSEEVTCKTCGGGFPLCARPHPIRDYVIVFPAHGITRKRVGTDQVGGCYAAGGNVALHWRKLAARAISIVSDGDALRAFVYSLKPGRMLRQHIAGDIGKARSIPVTLSTTK
jgi:hypothetical protein